MNKLGKVAAAFAAALALAVIPSAPAFADQTATTTGAVAHFQQGPDMLSAGDTSADGKSATAQIRANSTAPVLSLTNSGGSGTTAYQQFTSIPANYQIRACVQDIGGGGARTCSAWKAGT